MHPIPRRFHALALAAALLTAVLSTWPVTAHLSDHVIDGARLINRADPDNFAAANIGADVITTVWILNWVLHALVTQPLHLFDANIFYPTPLATARQEHLFATDLLGAPGALLAGPIAAHQTALLLCIVLNGWSAAYVVTRWSGSLVGGLVAGVLFAVSPFHQLQVFHLQSLGTAYLPLLLLGLERFGATGRPAWAGLVTAALALQILSGQYLGYIAMVAAVGGGAVCLVAGRPSERPLRRLGRDVAWLAVAAVAAVVVVLPFVVPYFRLAATGDIPDNRSLMLNSWFLLRSYLPFAPVRGRGMPAATWLLAVLGAAALLARDRPGRVRALMLLTVGYAGALLSLGPRASLWGVLAAIVPGFGSMREPFRFMLLPCLAMAMLGGSGAAAAVRRFPRLGTAASIVLVGSAFLFAWRGPLPLRRLPVGADLPEAYRVLVRCGDGDPLIELPIGMPLDSWRDAEPQLMSVFHWLPLVNGRASYSPPELERIRTVANLELLAPGGLDELRRLTGVRWVLVHCAPTILLTMQELCREETWNEFPSGGFGEGDDRMRLFDLGRVATLPRPVPRREPPTTGCLSAGR